MGGVALTSDDLAVDRTLRIEDLSPDQHHGLTSAVVSDALDSIGLRNQVMAMSVHSLIPGHRSLGRAATVRFVPSDEDPSEPYDQAIAFIDSLDPGSVVVVASDGDPRSAYWGELFSAAARGRGATGTVCDGPVRDVMKIRSLGYPVFSIGSRPVDFRARMRIASMATRVRCAGVVVAQGDVVVADDDGVVVIPVAVEADVLAIAVSRVTTETHVRDALLDGASLADVWARWRTL